MRNWGLVFFNTMGPCTFGSSLGGRTAAFSIRGKARRVANLGVRLRLKIGYSHKIFLFLPTVVFNFKTKYDIFFLLQSAENGSGIGGVQVSSPYNQNGFFSQRGFSLQRRGKRS
jgi:hypothetical protein